MKHPFLPLSLHKTQEPEPVQLLQACTPLYVRASNTGRKGEWWSLGQGSLSRSFSLVKSHIYKPIRTILKGKGKGNSAPKSKGACSMEQRKSKGYLTNRQSQLNKHKGIRMLWSTKSAIHTLGAARTLGPSQRLHLAADAAHGKHRTGAAEARREAPPG